MILSQDIRALVRALLATLTLASAAPVAADPAQVSVLPDHLLITAVGV